MSGGGQGHYSQQRVWQGLDVEVVLGLLRKKKEVRTIKGVRCSKNVFKFFIHFRMKKVS